jgi:hypothetical protein
MESGENWQDVRSASAALGMLLCIVYHRKASLNAATKLPVADSFIYEFATGERNS